MNEEELKEHAREKLEDLAEEIRQENEHNMDLIWGGIEALKEQAERVTGIKP